jgi:hypothetical protein
MSNLVLSFVLKMINQAASPMRSAAGDLKKITDATKATKSPLGDAAKGLKQVGDAAKATKSPLGDASGGVKKLTGDLDKLQNRATIAGRAIGNGIRKLLVGGVVGAAAYATYVTTVYSAIAAGTVWVSQKAKEVTAIRSAAVALGVNTTSYQRLEYAYKSVELGGADLDSTMKALSRTAVAAARGNKEQAAWFAKLGVSVTGANGKMKHADVLLGEVADKFAKLSDGPLKATAAIALFGDAGTKLIPLLDQGAKGLKALGDEAEATGNVLGEDAVKNAQKLTQVWSHLKGSVFGLQNSIFAGLIPSVIKLVSWFDDLLSANREDILKGIRTGIDWLIQNLPGILDGIGKFWGFLRDIGGITATVTKALGGLNGVLDVLAVVGIAVLTLSLYNLVSGLAALGAAIFGVELAAAPIALTVAAIGAVAAGAYLLFRHWKPISKFFVDLWGKVKAVFTGFVDWVGKNWMKLPLPLKLLSLPIFIISKWKVISGFFGGLFDWLKNAWDGLPVWAQALISLPLTLVTHWKALVPAFQWVWKTVTGLWSGAAGFFQGVFAKIGSVITSAVSMIWSGLPDWFKTLLKTGAHIAADIVQFVAGGNNWYPSAPAAAAMRAPAQSSSVMNLTQMAQQKSLNGQLDITVRGDGSARVNRMQTSGPWDMNVRHQNTGIQGAGG